MRRSSSASLLLLLLVAAFLAVAVRGQVTSGGDFSLQTALGTGAKLPVFNANFSVNPATIAGVGPTLGYNWTAVDLTDTTANQGYHQGLLVLDGVSGFVNLSTAVGANSIGMTLPLLGTTSSSTTSPGWSFEFVWKPLGEQTTWAKLVDFGNGAANGYVTPGADDWTLGFDGNDATQFLLETYNSATPNYTHAYTQLQALQIGVWYHMLVVQTPVGTQGGASWYIYINGALQNWSYPLNGNAPLTTSSIQGANYPQPIPRSQAYIGKSNWGDPLMQAVVDSIRIYDYALSSTQAVALASLYALQTPPTSTGLNPTSYPPAGSTASGFTQPSSGESALGTSLGFGFQPVFNAAFQSNPAVLVGGTTGYTWLQQDPSDVATGVQSYHQGVVTMNATSSSFIDLVQVTGPNSIGQTLPILFGTSLGSGASYGWTIDIVVKPLSVQSWSKFFDLGTGAYIDSLYLGWQGGNNLWELAQYITVSNALATQYAKGVFTAGSSLEAGTNVLSAPSLGKWYHVAWVMQPASTDATFASSTASVSATWTIYVNGVAVVSNLQATAPLPIFRHVSYLGRSDWFQEGASGGDANINATYDAFRVWDRALSAAQVLSLANAYGTVQAGSNVTSVTSGGDFGLQAALGAAAKLPVFNANFSVNPATLSGVTTPLGYKWQSVDTTDTTANQGYHQGLLVLDGVSGFVNLSTAVGANSIGMTLPLLGTTSSSTTSPGWSFEFVWKPLGEQTTWAKLVDFGNGAANGYVTPGADDWTLGFDGNDATQFLLETYNSATPNYTHAYTQLQALQIGVWYHMLVVQTPVGTQGGASWYIYINGALQNWSYPLNGNAPLTTSSIQGANYPQPIPRSQAYIGKSNWGDPLMQAVVDSIRIYDYALSSTQAVALASLYALQTPPTSTGLNPTSYPPAGSTASGFTQPSSGESALGTSLGFGFQPVFNAAFQSNPAVLVGGTTGYTWLQQDPSDVATGVQSYHQGVVTMNATSSSFIDLVQVTGPNSIGQTLPILFGTSLGSGASYGWTIDIVVKPLSVQSWSKFFDLGTGAYIDSLYLGWQGGNNLWELAQYITVSNALATQYAKGVFTAGSSLEAGTNVLSAPSLGKWYHVAWVMQPASTDATFASSTASVSATWTIYVNGVAVVSNLQATAPLPIFRHVSYLGRSDWFQEGASGGDANINATYDAFRVWDRALSAAQVLSLANAYGTVQAGSNVTSVTSGGDFGLQAALGAAAKLPVFNANFSVNPATLSGVTTPLGYKWQSVDTTDTTANQGYHQGLLVLDGVSGFVNLSTAVGANSIGMTLPLLGTTSSSTTSPGWSFEFVWKPLGEQTTWAKLVDFGNGAANGYVTPGADDWTLGFDGNDATQFLLETYNSATPNYTHAYTQLQALQIGVWYHMLVVQTPVGTQGGASWYIYINGALQNWSYPLNGNAPLTTSSIQGANYPQPIPRSQAYIGKSNWGDPLMQAVVDSIRIYDYALSSTQAVALASLYALQTPPTSTGLNPTSYPPAGSTASGFTQPSSGESALGTSLGFGFQPVFNAAFQSNPAVLVGGTTGYTWLQQDPSDVATGVQSYHQGVVTMNATSSSFIDLVQVTGPNSIGQTLPILFGTSLGSGASYGWTIDIVVKPLSVQSWSKFFDLGTGAYIDSLYLGWQGGNNLWELAQYITVSNALATQYAKGVFTAGSSLEAGTNVLSAPSLGKWYHVAWVMQPASTDATFASSTASVSATWTIYVNGVAVVSNLQATAPLPIFRHVSYLGRSDWFQEGASGGDANINATYDAFRVWDRALSAAQVLSLANAYGTVQAGSNVTSVTSGGDFGLQAALGAAAKLPVFNANFSVNPATLSGVTTPLGYKWQSVDTTDTTANQGYHQGLLVLDGVSGFVNLSTAVGANSIGMTLPLLGTTSSSTTSPGWSFEFVWKPLGEQTTWAKLVDFGNGAANGYVTPGADDWTLGFDGNDATQFLLETYNSATPNYTHAYTQLQALQIGVWYHMLVVQTPVGTQGGASWYIYINGALQNWSYPLNGNAPLTTSSIQGANYPQPIPRSQAYIGKSNWGDPLMQAVVDSIRIYDYALSSTQAVALASLYALQTPPTSTGLNPTSYPPAGSTASGFTQPSSGESALGTSLGFGFQPVFNAAFQSNPAVLVGGTTGYTWLQQDPSDVATGVQSYHQGVVTMNATSSSFIDLVQVTGPNSIGQTLPILFGTSLGSGASYGWTIDIVVKPLSVQSWSKFFDLGTGAYIDSLYLGWQGGNNLWELAQYITVSNALATQYAKGVFTAGSSLEAGTNVLSAPSLGKWYHVAWVMQPASTDATFASSTASVSATWTIYVNGVAVVSNLQATAPLPIFRHVSYLGRSDWFQEGASGGDANINATYDAFRVWDRALSAAQVLSLANAYGTVQAGSNVTSVTSGGDFGLQAALGAAAKLPVFNANFSVNPATLSGVTTPLGYKWQSVDTTDTTANQGYHQGLLVLDGVSGFVNLSTAVGANSIGMTLPLLGTTSSSTTSPGWSFEFVWKPLGEQTTWAKLVDFGNGAANGYVTPGADDWTLGFDGNDATQFLLETYNSATPNYTHAYTQLQALQIGVWYHMLVVQTPVGTQGGASWYIYINGALQNWSYPLNGNAPLTTSSIQGANYPQPIPRSQAYIGKSNWGDPLMQAVVDSIRIYDYALSSTQAVALASLYALQTPPTSTGLNPTSYPPAGSTASGFTQPSSGESALGTSLGFGFQPVFNAAFQSNPAVLVGGTTGYTWLQQDPSDVATGVQSYHQGVVTMNATSSSFIDLVQVTGPNSIGQTLPILFGTSLGSGASYGWTIDIVVKPLSVQSWSKFFDLGTGAYIDSLYLGWQGGNNLWELAQYITVSNALATQYAKGVFTAGSSLEAGTNVLSAPSLGKWYHVAWVMQPASTDATFASSTASVSATWTIYVNGVAVVSNLQATAPLPIFRHVSYLGRSDWFQEGASGGDANINATYDAFRVWDRALSAAQVLSLANAYGTVQAGSNVTSVTSGGDFGLQAALGAAAKLPVFNANFSVNPATLSGVTTPLGYKWQSVDTTDTTANQGYHQGLLVLDGVSGFVNLSTAVGANSIGMTLPLLGTTSSSTTSPGWSFEFVWKPLGEQTTWAKLVDFGNGAANGYVTPGADDWTLGFDGNDATQFLLETYNSATPNYTHAYTQLQALQIGVWYHMLVVQTPVGTQGGASWYIYINGALQNWSYPLNGNAPLTTSSIQGANYPQPIPRSQAYIGKSNWGDPLMQAVVDSIRIYDYALSSTQAVALASLYALQTPPTSTGLNPTSYPPAGSTASGFTQPSSGESALGTSLGFGFQPVFNAAFQSNPAVLVGGTTGYTWLQQDPSDVATGVQSYHQGVVTMNATSSSFIDLVQVTGPNSIGQTLPILFGTSLGSGASYGWTIDIVVKPLSVQSWSKFFDLGTGAYIDSLYLGWQGGNNLWELAQYITVSNALATQYAKGVFTAGSSLEAGTNVLSAPSLGKWYHVAWVMQPASTDATFASSTASVSATWTIYVNGVAVVSNLQATAPLPIFRHVSYLGRSDWFQEGASGGDANINATYDAFRVWDRALSAAQVRALATTYGVAAAASSTVAGTASPTTPVAVTSAPAGATSARTVTSTPAVAATSTPAAAATSTPAAAATSTPAAAGTSTPAAAATSAAVTPATSTGAAPPSGGGGSSSKLSGGGIAGVVIGSVVGAGLLCALLFCAFFMGGRRKQTDTTEKPSNVDRHHSDASQLRGNGDTSHGSEHSGGAGLNTDDHHDDEVEMGTVHA